MDGLLPLSLLLGQTLIGFYFVFFGFWNIYHWSPTLQGMIENHIPLPWVVLAIGITWQVFTGCMILFGLYLKLIVLSLIPFIFITISIFHPFWKFHGALRRLHFALFMTHLTMTIGGLLLLINNSTSSASVLNIFVQ